ncbi:MAG TPA: DUF3817 domain-containing protein [Pseudonocardiaceae bacterium]
MAWRLTVYRVLAYATGVLLIVVTVATVMNFGFGDDRLGWTAVIHGYLYMVYLVSVVVLGTAMRWRPVRMLLVALAGTIPLMSFVAERSVTREVSRKL